MRLLIIVAAAVIAGAAPACGTSAPPAVSSGDAALASPAAAARTAPAPGQIVAAAAKADAAVESGRFAADVTFTISGDGAGLGIPQVRQLVGRPVALRIEGNVATKPVAIDGTLTLSLAGQNVALGLKAVGGRAWVEYADTWYRLPPGPTTALLAQIAGSPGAVDLTRQLVSMGLDSGTWHPGYALVGIESRDGVAVYHIRTSVDAETALADIDAALASPDFWTALGLRPAEAESVRSLVARLLSVLEPRVTEITRESWIGVDDHRTRKSTVTFAVDFGEQAAKAGLDGLEFALEFDAARIGEPVTVEAPARALPFRRLRKILEAAPDGLLGGL